MSHEKILVLDFGGQYNQLIARRVRDHHVYAEIKSFETPIEEIKAAGYKGIIFTGGPNSVYDMTSPHYDKAILDLGIPVLGICYGCQLISWMSGGKVESCKKSEYGMRRFQSWAFFSASIFIYLMHMTIWKKMLKKRIIICLFHI